MNPKLNKKGFTLGNVPGLAITLVIIAIVLGIAGAIIGGFSANFAENVTRAHNASQLGGRGIQTFYD